MLLMISRSCPRHVDTQERPFLCSQCDSRFTRSDLLIRHERLSHGRDGSDPRTQATHRPSVSTGDGVAKRPRTAPRGRNRSGSGSGGGLRRHQPSPPRDLLTPRHSPQAQQPLGLEASILALGEYESATLAADDAAFDAVLTTSPQFGAYPASAGTGAEGFVDADGIAFVQKQQQQQQQPQPDLSPAVEASAPAPASDDALGSFTDFLDMGAFSSFHFAPSEQPLPPFSFESFGDLGDAGDDNNMPEERLSSNTSHDISSFSRFGSRLPSLQPDDPEPAQHHEHEPDHPLSLSLFAPTPKHVSDISAADRQAMADAISPFAVVLPQTFTLPTRLALARYVRAYVDGFHDHLPFLHVASMAAGTVAVELLLAMAAVGAQYCFEQARGVDLFHAARAIALERIRRRDACAAELGYGCQGGFAVRGSEGNLIDNSAEPAGDGDAGGTASPEPTSGCPRAASGLPCTAAIPADDLMQSAQALLLLMAMATWGNDGSITREAVALQSVLASVVRDDDGLAAPDPSGVPCCWAGWARGESVLRTKEIVFCFFNLHTIVYDLPPLILNAELRLRLPCAAAAFRADTPAKWRAATAITPGRPPLFHDALRRLFQLTPEADTAAARPSSLGNYVLIHAIIQHIFLVRQTASSSYPDFLSATHRPAELPAEHAAPLERALRNWQRSWERSPESSLSPSNTPHGPVAFNSTALLRLAYVRLAMDTGPGRALGTRDPAAIARALLALPLALPTTTGTAPRLLRALLHAAHALSIPVKIGVRLVARAQTFLWSIQHALCSLECALLLSKWLEAVSVRRTVLTADERRVLGIVRTMLDETEFAVPLGLGVDDPETARRINSGVLRVWATIFRGAQTWAVVDVIGCALHLYADMLEGAGV
ncbi:zinc finger protein ADR1 [Lasiosphaeria ovina]|uniref:Zinc finger protein ADR1 n=1 Tax=Lasiosphaeria ovina TaxID=92902 RepID=A0AAE0KBI3_9PEZI|nr:zinc finger protein ADR1 [Lasiosphaeria ovina]